MAIRQLEKSLYIYKIMYIACIYTHIYACIHIYRDYIDKLIA